MGVPGGSNAAAPRLTSHDPSGHSFLARDWGMSVSFDRGTYQSLHRKKDETMNDQEMTPDASAADSGDQLLHEFGQVELHFVLPHRSSIPKTLMRELLAEVELVIPALV